METSDDKAFAGLDAIRRQLTGRLPSLIAKAAADHQELASAAAPSEARDFAAHQGACRAALAHMEQLIKMARWAEGSDFEARDGGDNSERLIAKAKAAIKDHPEEEE